jgi:hypothetical protein
MNQNNVKIMSVCVAEKIKRVSNYSEIYFQRWKWNFKFLKRSTNLLLMSYCEVDYASYLPLFDEKKERKREEKIAKV